MLTAAGVTGAFGAIYAAHALYGFIEARTAFPALGIVALAAIAAAMLHGPALAGLGLVGALATPLLVSSARPDPWPVVVYLAVVVSAAYALARLRRWLWLAVAAAIGAGLWTLLLEADSHVTGIDAAYGCLVVQLALAGLAFAIFPHRGESDEFAEFDPVASIVLVGFALLAIVVLAGGSLDASVRSSWVVASVASMAILAFVGAQAAPAAAAIGAAGLVAWGQCGSGRSRARPPTGSAPPGQSLHMGEAGSDRRGSISSQRFGRLRRTPRPSSASRPSPPSASPLLPGGACAPATSSGRRSPRSTPARRR